MLGFNIAAPQNSGVSEEVGKQRASIAQLSLPRLGFRKPVKKQSNRKSLLVEITAFDILTVKWKTLNRGKVLKSEAGSAP